MYINDAMRAWPLLAAGLLAFASSTPCHAGSPRFYVEYTNMTPNELSNQASKQCSNVLRGRLGPALDSANEVADPTGSNTVYIDEAERRKRVQANGGDTTNFMGWGAKEIPLDDFTFAVAVDCRPDKQLFDALLVGRKGSVTLRLRGVALNSKRLGWLVDDLVVRIESMYSK